MSGVEGADVAPQIVPREEEGKDELKRSVAEFLKSEDENARIGFEDDKSELNKVVKKRKKSDEVKLSLNIFTEVFLQIFYPISKSTGKYVTTGLVKPMDYFPNVILNHGSKMLTFTVHAWDSFIKHLHLIECYLSNNMMGRKTNIRLLDCDIEIDIIKQRGDHQVRFKDLTKYEDKILLSREEFYILNYVTPAVARYMKQLVFSHSVLREYLIETLENQPDVPILHGPIDTSIFNRIPHEVEMWRRIKEYEDNIKGGKQILNIEGEEGGTQEQEQEQH